MGENHELERSAAHLTTMASRLHARGARVVIVSLVPRPPTCASCIAMFAAAHEAVVRVAALSHAPLVTMRYDAAINYP